ncbi:MAG: outer membrane beta-barrel protein [Candidatus Cryptobacteroides sp.]
MRNFTHIILTFILLSISTSALSQQRYLRGRICDSLSTAPLAGVVVELNDEEGNNIKYTTSGEDGEFSFKNIQAGRLSLHCSILGYKNRIVSIAPDDNELGTILMREDAVALDAAVHSEQALRTSQSGDTLIYNAAAYKTMMGASSEDLISKMPGISVASRSVEANGKKVNKVLIDGKEYFDDDVMTALRNVPADLVSQIEVMERRSDEAELTGMDDGNEYTAINIVTKRKGDKEFLAGRIYGGYGIPDKYIGGGNLNYFGKERSLTVLGMANNISKYNFVSDDLVSASASDGGSNGSDFSVKSLDGISSVQSAGANYSNKWFNGSYMFNHIDNHNLTLNDRLRTVSQGLEQLTGTETDFNADNSTHRFSARISSDQKKRHTVIIRPSLTYQDLSDTRSQLISLHNISTDGDGVRDTLFKRNRSVPNDNDRWNVSARLSANYRYRFKKPGRSLGINAGGSYYHYSGLEHSAQYVFNDEEDGYDIELADSWSKQYRDRGSENWSFNAGSSYTEPLSRKSRLSIDYKYSQNHSSAENFTYLFNKKNEAYNENPDKRQSAVNSTLFATHTAGARYSFTTKRFVLTGSMSYQRTDYNGSAEMPVSYSVHRGFNNLIYSLIGNLRFNPANTLRLTARSFTTNPTASMMQNVVNLNNPSYIRSGNPDINPSSQHSVEGRYVHTNRKKGSTLSLSMSFAGSANYHADSLVIDSPDFEVAEGVKLGEGNQYTKPINLSGFHRLTGKISFGCPVKFISSNFNINASGSMSTIPGMINADKVPVHRNSCSLGTRLDSNLNGYIDFTLSWNGQYTMNEYSDRNGVRRNNYFTQHARGSLKWIIWKGLTFNGSVHFQQNLNIDRLYNDKLLYCDLFIGKKLFRNQLGEISIGVNDLCNATARNFRHSISTNGSSDSVYLGLGRYFSLQMVYHLRH